MPVVHTLESVERFNGTAGQYCYVVQGRGENIGHDYEWKYTTVFVGTEHGDGVVVIGESGSQTRVYQPERFGPWLDPEWIRRFYAN
jgi:hypothetical protein